MTKKIITVLLSLFILVPCFSAQAEPQGLGVELLGNTSFETPNAAGNGAAGWTPYGQGTEEDWSQSADFITWSTEQAHTGSYSVKVDNTAGKKDWVRFYIPDGMIPGAYYRLSYWVWCDSDLKDGAGFKFEWQTDTLFAGENPGGNKSGNGLGNTEGEWKQYTVDTIAPDLAVGVVVYVRMYKKGIAYFDDVSLTQISESIAKPATFFTNNIFYETGHTGDIEGTLTRSELVISTNHVNMENATVVFSIVDGETVLQKTEALPFAGETVSASFDFSLLAEKEKEYKFCAALTDGDGKTYEFVQRIYKFDPPTTLNEEGLYVLDSGEILDPVFAYHAGMSAASKGGKHYLEEAKSVGANVVQMAAGTDPAKVGVQLDLLQQYGLMGLVCLYPDMTSAGNPEIIPLTREIVTTYKDHPAVFAWAVMDEPFQQIYATDDPTQNRDNELIAAYLNIRELDKHHPVYICECQNLEGISRYSDVFLIDAYKKSYGQNTKAIQELHNFDRPVYTLLPTFTEGRDTIDTYRFQFYDAFFEGAVGTGMYGIEYFFKVELGTLLSDLVTMNESGELTQAFSHFVHNAYLTLCEKVTEDEAYTVYVKDGILYAVIVNRTDAAKEVTVPLVSADGKIALGNAAVNGLWGAQETYRGENNAVTVSLGAKQAAVYTITPDESVDLSGLRLRSRFRDLNEIIWAKDSIEKLDSLGIVNDGGNPRIFSPQTKITRGEFAMFLVRTLGLTGDATENFSDVDPNAEYAKEIAIGRAAGILNGIGENLYNPEAEITRQDMMTIISRGMNLAGEADMTVFSDSGLVADYALAHVKAMISSGLIKGNADGTLNPTGNTTRAEVAVIMDRILSMN